MSDLFLDANVVLDVLLRRTPFDAAALRLFQLGDQGRVRLYVSAITFNNAYYIATRLQDKSRALRMMADLAGLVTITPVTESVIQQALSSPFGDFEDAIPCFSALQNSAVQCIVTRNKKDFTSSPLAVYSSDEVLALV
jgi:predicted nucleic acid-binding protein